MVFVLILRFWTPSPFRTFYTLCCFNLMIMVTGVCHWQTWTCVVLTLLVQASGWWIQTHDWNGSCGRGRGRVYMKPELQQWVSGWGDPEIDLQRKSTGPLSCCSVGNLQIRYNLGGTKEPYDIDVEHRSVANGQPHSVNITRLEKTIILKVLICV